VVQQYLTQQQAAAEALHELRTRHSY
jgi:hypothetical protein